jgi:undecaprenyl-diphosphatase
MATGLADLDVAALYAAQRFRSPPLDGALTLISQLGSLSVLGVLVAFAAAGLWAIGRSLEAGFICASVLGAAGIARLAKVVIHRPRPSLFPALVPTPTDFSFPSGHAAQIAAAASALYLLLYARRHSTLQARLAVASALTVVSLVGMSRIYLQVHYPSDVAAGMISGFLWVIGLSRIMGIEHRGR